MDVKKTLWDYGKSVIRELVKEPDKSAGAKPARLEDIKVEDLKRKKVRLELEERKTLNEVSELEAEKQRLFKEGARTAGTREARITARKLLEVDSQASNLDRLLESLSANARLINGLIQVKELARIQKESGLGDILEGFDLQELVTFIDDAYVEGELNQDKVNELLGTLERKGMKHSRPEDQDLDEIMKQFEIAHEALDNPEALDQKYQELTVKMEAKRAAKEKPQAGEEY